MTSISVTLYIPANTNPDEVCQYLSSHGQNVGPPFQKQYQNLIHQRYGNSDHYNIEKFNLDFPRGPLRWNRRNVNYNSSSSSRSIVERINNTFRDNLSRPMPVSNQTSYSAYRTSHMASNRASNRYRPLAPESNATLEFKCNICLEECKQGERQQILPCLHKFHASCVNEWIARNNSCPTCRTPVVQNRSTPVHNNGSRISLGGDINNLLSELQNLR